MDVADTVKEGDTLILKKENNLKIFKLWKKRKVFMERRNFLLDAAIGHPYGTVWEVRNDVIVQIPYSVIKAEQLDIESGGDNRNIVDDSSTQKMSREDIVSLKESGQSGEKIIDQIVENSSSFKGKNVYSQAKYRKKKRDKHLTRFQILRPSTRLMCEMHWNKPPSKHIQMRADTLAQILTLANVQSTSKVMLIESTQGLMLGAIMERLAGKGSIVQFHSEDQPVRLAVDAYNFPKTHFDTVHSMLLGNVGRVIQEINCTDSIKEDGEKENMRDAEKIVESEKPKELTSEQADSVDSAQGDQIKTEVSDSTVSKVDASEPVKSQEDGSVAMDTSSKEESVKEEKGWKGKRKPETPEDIQAKQERHKLREEKFNKVKDILKPKDMDVLVIVTRFQPSPILMALIDLLSLSRPFVVFCTNKEPLMECYLKLRDRGGAINLRITETWLRNYQVLPRRTHPLVMMSGTGGYLLSGLTVEPPAPTPTSSTS